jgi:ATP-dependent RNA helicase DeaD
MQERPMPTDEDVEQVVAERITALLEAKLRTRDKLQTERSQRFIKVGRSLAESEDESAIIAMLLDDYYQQTLHAPVPVPDKSSEPPPVKSSSGSSEVRPRRRTRRR